MGGADRFPIMPAFVYTGPRPCPSPARSPSTWSEVGLHSSPRLQRRPGPSHPDGSVGPSGTRSPIERIGNRFGLGERAPHRTCYVIRTSLRIFCRCYGSSPDRNVPTCNRTVSKGGATYASTAFSISAEPRRARRRGAVLDGRVYAARSGFGSGRPHSPQYVAELSRGAPQFGQAAAAVTARVDGASDAGDAPLVAGMEEVPAAAASDRWWCRQIAHVIPRRNPKLTR